MDKPHLEWTGCITRHENCGWPDSSASSDSSLPVTVLRMRAILTIGLPQDRQWLLDHLAHRRAKMFGCRMETDFQE
jgi:hypothetical protein